MRIKSAGISLAMLIISAVTTASGETAQCDNFADALTKAGQAKKDILVLVHGSDWCKPGEAFRRTVWDSATKDLPDLVFARADERETQDDKQKSLKEQNKEFKVTVWNMPALVYCDSEGRPVAVIEGVAGMQVQAVIEFARKSKEKRSQRDNFLAQARGASGKDKALHLGRALDSMDYKIARSHYSEEIKQIRSADPNDASGYARKYEYNSNNLMEHKLWKLTDEKKYDEAVKLVNEQISSDKLYTWQKQELSAMHSYIYNRWNGRERDYTASLERIVALDTNSDTAEGARNLLNVTKRKQSIEQLKKEIVSAESSRDFETYARIGKQLSGMLQPGETHPEAGARMPAGYVRPEGTLVSEQGFVTFSSLDSEWDVPWAHPLIGRDKLRGFFHTRSEKRPWVKIDLKKETELRSIVIVNRPSCPERQAPLKVSVSSDDSQWKEVFRSNEVNPIWLADLTGRGISARYVKVENDDDRSDFFHLSNVLVFGK